MKSFNKIMSVFTGTIAKLDKLSEKNIEKKIAIDDTINQLCMQSEALLEEAMMADRTAMKLKEFMGVE